MSIINRSCIFLVLLSPVFSQHNSVRFDHLTVEDGLSQGSVYSIIQDESGFMWFGTRSGLNRYDGKEFRLFTHDPKDSTSLPGYQAVVLMNDHEGTLWVGTDTRGLSIYSEEKENFTNFSSNSSDPGSLSNNQITCIFEDSENTIWVGTRFGLNRLDLKTSVKDSKQKDLKFVKYFHTEGDSSSLSSSEITAITEISKGTLLLGLGNGSIATLNLKTNTIKNDQTGPFQVITSRHWPIRFIKLDDSGEFAWIAKFGSGLIKYDLSKGVVDHYYSKIFTPDMVSTNFIYTISQDAAGKLWLPTARGLTVFDPLTEEFSFNTSDESNPESVSDQILYTGYIDTQGLVWIGSDTRGVNIHKPNQIRFELFSHESGNINSPSANNVYSMAEDKQGDIWFTTIPGGTNRYNPATGSFRYYQTDDSDPNVWSINYPMEVMLDSYGVAWVGTVIAGLSQIDPESGKRLRLHHYDRSKQSQLSGPTIFSLLESEDGTVWVGTEINGLNRYNRDSNNFTHYKHDLADPTSLSGNCIYVIFEDHAGVLWVGTDAGGLNRFHPESGTFTSFMHVSDNDNSLTSNCIFTIHEDSDYNLWIGTQGGGLNKLDSTRQLFSTLDLGFENEDLTIHSIEEDNHDLLWLSTNNGLIKADPEKGFLNRYTIDDGLQGNEFRYNSSVKDSKGYLYFGGPNGFNRFHPDSIVNNPHVPPVVITDLSVNYETIPIGQASDGRTILSKSISMTDNLVLDHRDKTISFTFSTLDYSDPSRNRFSYLLENFDDDWVNAGTSHRATYTSLDPGYYIFRVKAANNDGLWNEVGVSLAITILPPFWQTWWFRLLTSLTLILMVYIYIRLRFRRMVSEKRRLEGLVIERTSELKAEIEEKMQIKVDHLKRELVSKSVCATQKQEIMNNLFHELKDIQKMDADEMRNRFNRIVRYFKDMFKSGEEWGEFEKWFTEVHTDFFKNIRNKYPELSQSEVKVCALLKLNLLSKDIANLMNVQPTTVDIYRHRIRKKIRIKPEINLNQFLAEF